MVVGLAASGVLPILISAITGCAYYYLPRCLDLNDVYHRINWQVIFLLAGMIPFGIAMNNTGADKWISDHLLESLSGQSNIVVIGLIFLITMLMSSMVSNNATAIIMTPIAIAVGIRSKFTIKAFYFSGFFGANFSFFTPMGYQTNTLIYGMGFYKFKHFVIIGGILSINSMGFGYLYAFHIILKKINYAEKFSINDSISNLWDKLDGWLDAIILKLPNFAVAILVMIIFYFIAKGLKNFRINCFLERFPKSQ